METLQNVLRSEGAGRARTPKIVGRRSRGANKDFIENGACCSSSCLDLGGVMCRVPMNRKCRNEVLPTRVLNDGGISVSKKPGRQVIFS